MLVDFLRWKYKLYSIGMGNATNASLTLSSLLCIRETQLMPRVIQLLCVRLLTTLWSNMFCEEVVHNQIVAHCIAKLNCVSVERLNQPEIMDGYAPISYPKKFSASTFPYTSHKCREDVH